MEEQEVFLTAPWVIFGTVHSMEWSLGAELWSGVEYCSVVESNFGVAKILITPANSVYLTFSNIWTGHF